MKDSCRGEGLGYQESAWRVRGCVGLKNFEGFGRFVGLGCMGIEWKVG